MASEIVALIHPPLIKGQDDLEDLPERAHKHLPVSSSHVSFSHDEFSIWMLGMEGNKGSTKGP